jgi:hypothetical protein
MSTTPPNDVDYFLREDIGIGEDFGSREPLLLDPTDAVKKRR